MKYANFLSLSRQYRKHCGRVEEDARLCFLELLIKLSVLSVSTSVVRYKSSKLRERVRKKNKTV